MLIIVASRLVAKQRFQCYLGCICSMIFSQCNIVHEDSLIVDAVGVTILVLFGLLFKLIIFLLISIRHLQSAAFILSAVHWLRQCYPGLCHPSPGAALSHSHSPLFFLPPPYCSSWSMYSQNANVRCPAIKAMFHQPPLPEHVGITSLESQ